MEDSVNHHMPGPTDKRERSALSNDTGAKLPFPASCRARAMGDITDFSECLSKEPASCAHGIPFGEYRFCRHPQHKKIVARTSRSDS
jgi:hypothetical protein